MTTPPVVRAALVSVGGSAAPILVTLRQHRPPHVWYFCSAGSRSVADGIHAQLDWNPAPRFIEVERFEELGPCYRELRRKLPEILAESRVTTGEVLVDYTGGTKTMSAALVLAATELFNQFSYVGGEQRASAGLGVTVDGKERVFYQGNPWSDLAVREIERARDLWHGLNYSQAAETLREAGRRSGRKLANKLAELADALAARHRLDFAAAWKGMIRIQEDLDLLVDANSGHPLPAAVRAMTELCRKCAPDQAHGPTLLRELLDNALRTAAQHRYDDAAARLYRAMEMQGQLWLAEKTEGLFVHGRCKAERVVEVPPALAALEFCQPDFEGKVELSLEKCFRALHALGDGRVAAVVADIEHINTKGKPASRWRQATEKRNASILAHGVQPIGLDGFETMKKIATEFLGFDLTRETNPIVRLDPRWLESSP